MAVSVCAVQLLGIHLLLVILRHGDWTHWQTRCSVHRVGVVTRISGLLEPVHDGLKCHASSFV
jgi:hypothetical protein